MECAKIGFIPDDACRGRHPAERIPPSSDEIRVCTNLSRNCNGLNCCNYRVNMRPPLFFLALVLTGCTSSEESFTLYRSALIGETARFHVFTFDAAGGGEYNMNNCHLAAERFAKQQGDHYKFWCERGPHQK
jgi:hypothetical protein